MFRYAIMRLKHKNPMHSLFRRKRRRVILTFLRSCMGGFDLGRHHEKNCILWEGRHWEIHHRIQCVSGAQSDGKAGLPDRM